MTRRAWWATSSSWVMSTIVRPSALRWSNTANTSPVHFESRLPVGSSASTSDGSRHERPGDGDALLLAAGELRRQVVDPIGEPDGTQRGFGPLALAAAAHPRVDERELDVGERGGAGDEVEALEDEADLAIADVGCLVVLQAERVGAVEQKRPRRGLVEEADDVHERALAAARAAHDGDVVAPVDHEVDAVERHGPRWHPCRTPS